MSTEPLKALDSGSYGELSTRPMPVTAMPIEVVKAVDEERGYSDIDAAKVWEEWQILSPEIRMQRVKDAAP